MCKYRLWFPYKGQHTRQRKERHPNGCNPTSVTMRPLGVCKQTLILTAAKMLEMNQQVSWHRSHNCCLFFSTYAPILLSPSFFSMKLLSWGSSSVFGSKSAFFFIQANLIATIIFWSIFISNRPIGSFGSQLTTWNLAAVYNTICCLRLRVMGKKRKWKEAFLFPRPFCTPRHPP